MQEEIYYAWTPLLVGVLVQEFPELVVRGNDGKPVLFEKVRENGRSAKCYGFVNASLVRKFVHEEYASTKLPDIENQMKQFLHAIKESTNGRR